VVRVNLQSTRNINR